MSLVYDEARIRAALFGAWSLESAVQWTLENPALGHCNVTAVLIHHLFGAEILRTRLPGVWHYYNRIGGKRADFTDSQFFIAGSPFAPPDPYQDRLSSRTDAMIGNPEREYETLKNAFLREFEGDPA